MDPLETIHNARVRLAAGAKCYESDIVQFLRDLIAIPAESGHEQPVIERIRQEMQKVGFDEIRIDGMGNILGRIGSGKRIIMMDSHTDTVGVGDVREWKWDPYRGKVEGGYVYGRGACDQHAGMASMVYGAKSIGEVAIDGPAPAIANAIYRAIGIRFRKLPIRAEDVWRALREQELKRRAAAAR